jgi:plastocyanin
MTPFRILLSILIVFLAISLFNKTTPFLFIHNPTVYITDNGLNPEEITINPGQIIKFVNQSSTNHWIASNSHPTHEMFYEFDELTTLSPGETWEFKFKYSGDWPYHDHLNPSLNGIIHVTGNIKRPNLSGSVVSKEKVLQEINDLLKQKDATQVWQYFYQKYPFFYQGHDIAHFLGSEIYKQSGLEQIKACNNRYGFGCHHGFIEELINQRGLTEVKNLIELCHKSMTGEEEWTCYHGIGHGFTTHTKYVLEESLKLCDQYLSISNQQHCYNGVFMEFATVSLDKVNKDNPLWPCNSLQDKYQKSCYSYQFQYLNVVYQNNSNEVYKTCLTVPDNDNQKMCLRGLYKNLALRYNDHFAFTQSCKSFSEPKEQDECIMDGAEVYVFYQHSIEEIQKNLCEEVSESRTLECYARVRNQSKL